MFKIELIQTTVVQEKKTFKMKSLAEIEGLVLLNKSSLNVYNFRQSLIDRFVRKEHSVLVQSAAFIAQYNTVSKQILILKNRITGDVGVFDYV